jgi:hypothetical protein
MNEEGMSRRWTGRGVAGGCLAIAGLGMLLTIAYARAMDHLPQPEAPAFSPRIEMLDQAVDALPQLPSGAIVLRRPDREDGAGWEPILRQHTDALNEIRKRLELPESQAMWPERAPPHDDEKYRQVLRELCADARIHRSRGQTVQAMNSALDLVEIGCHLSFEEIHGTGEASLVNAFVSMGATEGEKCLVALTQAEARKAGKHLERIDRQFASADTIVLLARGDALQQYRGFRQDLQSNVLGGTGSDWRDAISDRWYQLTVPKIRGYREIDRYCRQLSREVGANPESRILPMVPHDRLAAALALGIPDRLRTYRYTRSRVRILRAELAIQQYYRKHGDFPNELAELDDVAPGALVDPFDGGPLRYRRAGADYLLYSVGPDGKDDGGRPVPYDDYTHDSPGDLVAGKLSRLPVRLTPIPR